MSTNHLGNVQTNIQPGSFLTSFASLIFLLYYLCSIDNKADTPAPKAQNPKKYECT